VIVLTGQTDYETDQAAMQAGAADYLVKGQVDPSMLERAIRYAMERKRVELALQNARDELESRVEERTAALSRANAELQQLAAALREADRRKDEFLAMLAHELRNPLGAISNAAQLLKRCVPEAGEARTDPQGQGPGRLRRAVDTLERQIRHQTHIVDDLLDVSRITRGKISLEREWFDLAWLVRHGVEDHRSAFEAAGLALHLELPEEPVWLAGDRTRLNQVLENLLTNAAKFTPTGGEVCVSLTVGPADSTRSGGGAERRGPVPGGDTERDSGNLEERNRELVEKSVAIVSVRDTGIGIDPAMLPRVFDSFAQADQSLDRRQGGLGLGLAVVKGLIELHGGEVRADSPGLGQGAEFCFTVPIEPVTATGREAGLPPQPAPPGRRILVVEDNPDSAETLRDLLELSGHQVAVAASGPEAVLLARTFRPEVVLCDIGLPGMDGYGVAELLRRDPETADARLIALSGYAQEEDRHRSHEAGFQHHLPKPVNLADLEALLAADAPAAAPQCCRSSG
jgi:signal transduction histidine kinase